MYCIDKVKRKQRNGEVGVVCKIFIQKHYLPVSEYLFQKEISENY